MGMFDAWETQQPVTPPPITETPKDIPTYYNAKEPNPKLAPLAPRKPYEDINAKGELTGYWWYQGETIDLEFNIEGEVFIENENVYIPAEDFVKGKSIIFKLYNFRRELILDRKYNGDTTIVYTIDSELSKSLAKGVYYCTLDLFDGDLLCERLYLQDDVTLTVR